jgi:hypothetical protein
VFTQIPTASDKASRHLLPRRREFDQTDSYNCADYPLIIINLEATQNNWKKIII